MKKVLFGMMACTMLLASCKKEDNNNDGDTTLTNGWKLNSTVYTKVASSWSSNGHRLLFTDAAPTQSGVFNALQIQFSENVWSDDDAVGTYKVRNGLSSPEDYAADEIGVAFLKNLNPASSSAEKTYSLYPETATTDVTATVTKTDGKLKIVIPKFDVSEIASGAVNSGFTLEINVTK